MEIYSEVSKKTSSEVFNPTHNKISVRYMKDRNRGMHIFFSKVDRTNGLFESVMIMDDTNFSMNIKKMARSNKKTIAMVEGVVSAHSDNLLSLYDENNRKDLKLALLDIMDEIE